MNRTTDINRAFGAALRELRLQADMSQEEIALQSGLSPTYVGQLERGLRSPSLGVILGLAAVLDVAAYELVRAAEIRVALRRSAASKDPLR
ncbi:MAG TPA: helix-turn-helix transcriptional regulator [Chloroflexota bacterium]|nr:helix-turn-helix transcriptional regulator [Chloroflexota bacterium]